MRLSSLATTLGVLAAAASANASELREVDGGWTFGEHALDERASDWEVASVTTVDGTGLVHVVFAPLDAVPDSHRTSYLLSDTEVVATWNSTIEERIRAIDLDGDSEPEVVRDLAMPAPCGIFVWRQPAVLGDGLFTPVEINAAAASERHRGRAGSAPQSTLSEAFDSSDRYLAAPGDLVDGDPATAWLLEGGAGAWTALRAPDGARVGGLRLSGNEGDGPLVVNVRFGDGASATLEVDGLHREYAVPTESRCAVITAVHLGGREQVMFAEASLVSSTDAIGPSTLVDTFWSPALAAACSGSRDTAEVAERLVETDLQAAAAAFQRTDEPCVAAALAHAIAPHDPDGALRTAEGMSDAATVAAQGSAFDVAATQRLGGLIVDDPAWLPGLSSAADGHSDVALGALYLALDEARFEVALQLAPSATPVALAEMLADDSADAWIRSLRVAHTFAEPLASPETVRRALAHDNGTVARLGIALIARASMSEMQADLEVIAQRDPISTLRAAAIAALDAMGTVSCGDHVEDPAPDVRAAVAGLGCASTWLSEDPTRLPARLTDETWPEVRAAWLQAAARAGSTEVDNAALTWLIDVDDDDDIAAAFLALRVRGTTVPTEAIDLMIARDDSRTVLQAGLGLLRYADVLPRAWLQSLPEAAGYSEQMAPTVEALLE